VGQVVNVVNLRPIGNRPRGMARFEVLDLDADRELIRSLARRLADDGPHSVQIGNNPARGGILAALRRSPLVGADLDLTRPATSACKVEL